MGLGPIWMSENEKAKKKASGLLKDGGVFAFGLSEREHGADIYGTALQLVPKGEGRYVANGEKYYIGNANESEMISTFGKLEGWPEEENFVFFSSNVKNKGYELVDNIVAVQDYVGNFKLIDYPVTEEDILSKGRYAWECCLNTINIGKYQLAWASIGICEHALYETLNYASNLKVHGKPLIDRPEIQETLIDSYSRILAMRLFAHRANDYFRSASLDDRRYLLYNPVMKMKVTTEGEDVMDNLWGVLGPRGFDKDTFFEMGAVYIRALPRLEGTVHINTFLLLKFRDNYFFNPGSYPEIGKQTQPRHDYFLFNQGSTHGLTRILFHDYRPIYQAFNLHNVKVFREQIEEFREMLEKAPITDDQLVNQDFTLTIGWLFALTVYGQLILEGAKIYGAEDRVLDQIFEFLVKDFSKFSLQLCSKIWAKEKQREYCMRMIKSPVFDKRRHDWVWENVVYALKDQYYTTSERAKIKPSF